MKVATHDTEGVRPVAEWYEEEVERRRQARRPITADGEADSHEKVFRERVKWGQC